MKLCLVFLYAKCDFKYKKFIENAAGEIGRIMKDMSDQSCTDSTASGVKALSFFSGAMGMDIGLERSGIHVRLVSEIDPSTRKTILLNKPSIGLIGDIHNYDVGSIKSFAGIGLNEEIDLVVGGPPCQSFSTAGKRGGLSDGRGNVFLTFLDRIKGLNPKMVVIENVRGLLSAPISDGVSNGTDLPSPTSQEIENGALFYIVNRLKEFGYNVSFNLYNAANFGTPQKRERVIIVGSRINSDIPFLTPTHSENGEFGLPIWRTFSDAIVSLKDIEHEFLKFPEKRLKYLCMLKQGEFWRHLPEEVQKEAMGDSYYSGGGKTGFYRRLAWDKPSPTLVTDPTFPATYLGHPELNRPLSVQEYMRVQEFPDEWSVFGSLKDKYRQIGNAVPVSLGVAIGKHVRALLSGSNIATYVGFRYSRYKNTTHLDFK